MQKKEILLGLPKGSLEEHTIKIFQAAGFSLEALKREYALKTDDPEIDLMLLRAQEIPGYIAEGKLDAGISGDDWILDFKRELVEVADLKYSKTGIPKKVRWVLAVPADSPISSVHDLAGKTISTENINLAKDYLKRMGVKANIEYSWGATEGKPPRLTDAIIDVTETGASLKANRLKVIDTVFESSTKFIANLKTWKNPWKKQKILDLALVLLGSVEGENAVNILMHAPQENAKKILKILPRLKYPTVKKLLAPGSLEILISCNKKESRTLIPTLKSLGASGIVEFPMSKLIP